MALDYRKCAEEIFSHLGGKENIISAAHCATRLRPFWSAWWEEKDSF